MDRDNIINALNAWIGQRPGLEFENYASGADYRSQLRGITRECTEARRLLRYVERSSITADQLLQASKNAFSGRLTLTPTASGAGCSVSYCIGQYWPTEYRAAVCAVLASAIWYHWREGMEGEDMAARIRRNARLEFGGGIASRWFS